jgi:uncharacterized membrane protein HdeD (DUF308 family)
VEKDWLSLGWKLLVARGVLGIVFGVVAMIWPVGTAITLALLWGIWALVDGIGSIAQAFRKDATGKVWLIVMGVISLIAAFFAIFRPVVTIVALTWILGIWLIVRGILELIGAFSSTIQLPRWLLIVGGLLSIVIGVLFVANPGTSAVVIAVWIGLLALLWGVVFVGIGLVVRSHLKKLDGTGSSSLPPPAPA